MTLFDILYIEIVHYSHFELYFAESNATVVAMNTKITTTSYNSVTDETQFSNIPDVVINNDSLLDNCKKQKKKVSKLKKNKKKKNFKKNLPACYSISQKRKKNTDSDSYYEEVESNNLIKKPAINIKEAATNAHRLINQKKTNNVSNGSSTLDTELEESEK